MTKTKAIEGEIITQDNSGESKGITTVDDALIPLTSEEITFSHLLAKGITLTKAYRQAFPDKCKDLKPNTIRQYASQLYTNANILTEVSTHQTRTAHLARLAEDRIEQILEEDDSMAKGNKVADVAMYMYDQANGKATQRVEMQSKHVSVTYNLSGKDEPVPQEILDQLADDPSS